MEQALIEAGWTCKPAQGFHDLIGPIWARRDGEAASWQNGFRVEERHLNHHHACHGGMIAAFADSVLGRAVIHATRPRTSVTVQLNMHFIGAAKLHDFVIGRAEIIRVTRSLVFVSGRFESHAQIVASADGVWKLLGDAQPQ